VAELAFHPLDVGVTLPGCVETNHNVSSRPPL
jgi:hypothetical protein